MRDDDNMPNFSHGQGNAEASSGHSHRASSHGGTIMPHGRQGLVLSRSGQIESEEQPQTTNYVRLVLHSLRGRYWLAVASGLVWAGIFCAALWYFVTPTYHSESLVHIAYTLPKVMHETDQTSPIPMFDAFMSSQRLLITSRRAVDSAIQDPVWKAMGRPVPLAPDKYFAEHLAVEILRGSEFIRVVVKDKEPGTPAAAVTAITNAYADIFNSNEKQLERQRLGLLEDTQTTLKSRMDELQKSMESKAREFGTTDLSSFMATSQAQLARVETALSDVRLALLGVRVAATQPATQPAGDGTGVVVRADVPLDPSRTDSPGSAKLEPEQIAAFDAQVRTSLEDEGHIKDQINLMERKGILDGNPTMRDLRQSLETVRDRIRSRMEAQENFHARTGRYIGEPLLAGGGPGPGVAGKTPEQLKSDEANLMHLRDETFAELKTMGNKQREFQRLKADIESAQRDYDELSTRMETLRTEGSIGSRLTVVSTGEIAISPDSDPRYKLLPVGALLGMLFPIACIVGMATLKGKVRYSDETESAIMPEIPFLGILPELGKDDLEGSDLSVAAAHSVHQIRVAIQSHDHDAEHRVYMITSATAGEGKTGLTMSLGLSYAASQVKTLVIDCDLVGRNLTSRLDARDLPGLREALEAGTAAGFCREMGNGLWVLTAGQGSSADAYTISAIRMRKLLAEVRKEFEVVIIDTGPILGSIEANILAREVDAVILTVARGRDRGMVRSAVRKLNMLGARPLGFVFNRAAATDFERSPYSSISSMSVVSTARDGGGTPQLKEFGPLVQAMAGQGENENSDRGEEPEAGAESKTE
jgi:polysaccharide biosynthesis transport protein